MMYLCYPGTSRANNAASAADDCQDLAKLDGSE
jgi:hypothetical protein